MLESLTTIFIMVFLVLVLFTLLLNLFQTPSLKGKWGENKVNKTITRKLDKTVYHLIQDVTLPIQNGTTQIDHVIVSKFGVFVIETKNMKGWIFGNERQKTWTQSLYKKKYKFQNPLHQNYKHTKTLENLLGLSSNYFYSVIIFIGDSTFKTDMPENVMKRGYIEYIKSKNIVLLGDTDVEKIMVQINANRYKKGYKTNREHVKNIKSRPR